jgi:hypothetical protein
MLVAGGEVATGTSWIRADNVQKDAAESTRLV